MGSLTRSFLLFTLSLILISHSPLPANAASSAKLIAQVCRNTMDNRGCLAILRANPRFSTARNYRDVSRFALELAVRKGTETQAFLKGLLRNDHSPSPSLSYCANFCYDGVVGSFKSALVGLTVDVLTASYDTRVAGDGATYCERELATHRIHNPAISSRNKEILLLSSITSAAVNMLPV